MSETTNPRWQAAGVAAGPIVLLAAVAYHPYIANLQDQSAVAGAMSADTLRWGLSHVAVGVASGLLLLAFLATRGFLRDAGEQRWSPLAVPFLVMGSVLFVFLPAMETAMVAAFLAGGDPVALQTELQAWFLPMLVSSALLFGVGSILMAAGIVRSGVFDTQFSWIVAGALAVSAVSRFVPLGRALYVGALAGAIALVPVAIKMWGGGVTSAAGGRTLTGFGQPIR